MIHFPDIPGIKDRLRKILSSEAVLTSGRIQLIGLNDIKLRLGNDWQRVEDAVHQLAELVISKHLHEDDIFLRYGNSQYLLIFAQLSDVEAQKVASKIVPEISNMLFGDERTSKVAEDIQIESNVVKVDAESLARLSGMAKVVGEASELGEDDLSWADTQSNKRNQIYMPLWSHEKQKFSAFWGQINHGDDPDTASLAEYRKLCDSLDDIGLAQVDLFILGEIEKYFQVTKPKDLRGLLLCPLHFSTLSIAEYKTKLEKISRTIPEWGRDNLVFVLLGVSSNMDRVLLSNVIDFLRPLCKSVWCLAPMKKPPFKLYSAIGLDGIVFFVSQNIDEDILKNWLDKIWVEIKLSDFTTSILDLPSMEMVAAAANAGFTFLGGKPIHGYVCNPEQSLEFKNQSKLKELIDKLSIF